MLLPSKDLRPPWGRARRTAPALRSNSSAPCFSTLGLFPSFPTDAKVTGPKRPIVGCYQSHHVKLPFSRGPAGSPRAIPSAVRIIVCPGTVFRGLRVSFPRAGDHGHGGGCLHRGRAFCTKE